MTASARHAFPRTLVILAASIVGFLLLQHDARVAESHAVAALLSLAGAHGTHVLLGTYIRVLPAPHGLLIAAVTPSCSSLASLVAVSCLAAASGRRSRGRTFGALLAALTVIATGNILRMAATLAVGLLAGRAVLVFFHNWVGGIFTFIYVLGGYVLFLYLVLPKRAAAGTRAAEAR